MVNLPPHGTAAPLVDASTLTLAVPAHADEVAGIRKAVDDLGRRAGLDAERRAGVALAVGEACANAVVHAYVGRPTGILRLTASATRGALQILGDDEGRGLVARTDSPGLGLGLKLMASLTTALDVREPEAGGTEVRMDFSAKRSVAAAALLLQTA